MKVNSEKGGRGKKLSVSKPTTQTDSAGKKCSC